MTIDQRTYAAVSLDVAFPDFPDAACIDADPEEFFPPRGGSNLYVTQQAKLICRDCPVRVACLSWALEHDEEGVWGGTTDKERARIRRGLRPARVCAACGGDIHDDGAPGNKPTRCHTCRGGI